MALLRRLMAAVRTAGICAMAVPSPLRSGPTTMSTVAATILDRRGDALDALALVAPDEGGTRTAAARTALRTAVLAISRAGGR
ncbi:hypothetical protein [Streptomyces griseus]|uniref:hypothetical protein n=1 Tax=Streptomyces griseus TaxID=1911 RepID=UPI0020C7C8C1|nr:hypothetical protein [Streptomyces griseus]